MRPGIRLIAVTAIAAAVLLTSCTTAAPAPTPTTAPTNPGATAQPTTAPSTAGEITIAGSVQGEAKRLNGAGATFPAVLYSKWFSEYANITGVEVNYQSIGSGGGIKGISDMTVDFGATDGPMTDEQLKAAKGGAVFHVPAALGGVAVTYNVPGVTEQLKFSPDTLASIFLGDIKKWSDPKIAADNPGVILPEADIIVVHRSDGSGTTFIFSDYLSSVSEKWRSTVGKGTSVNWPTGLGEKGNEGVTNGVKQSPNSIGYVEVIYALKNNLGVSLVKNQAGNFVEPNLDTVTAAAAGLGDSIAPDLRASIVNAPGDNAYPISGFTWLLVYENQTDEAKAIALTRVLWWATHEGQQYCDELGYAPLPKEIVTKAEAQIKSIKVGGNPVFPGR
jgi:phosphate transport system substrate-binding protein